MKENIVYKITNKLNQKYYFGSTSEKDKRMKKHFLLYKDTIKQNNELHKDVKKFGIENFNVEILFSSDNKIETSRMESKLIRENIGDEKMYNKSHGASGRRVFYLSDIEFIRNLYSTKTMTIEEAYERYYKDVVTFRAFKKVWHGDTFKDICSEVFTEENKKWYFSKGQSRPCEKKWKKSFNQRRCYSNKK